MHFSTRALFLAGILFLSVSIIPFTFADIKESSSSLNETLFQLKINQSASLESNSITVKFQNVTADSRCPSDVTCVWQGEAKIFVNIIKDNQDLGDFGLTSRAGEKDMAIQVFDGHYIQVTKVEPYPTSGKKIPLSDYVATFVISKSDLSSPSKQFKSGISSHDVKCREGLVLVIKSSYDSPACVKVQTAQKLVERGWGRIVTSQACPSGKTMINGQCVSSNPTTLECDGDTLIPYSYALPCMRPTPTCPSDMTYSNGVCTTSPPYIPPTPSQCDPGTEVCSSQGIAFPSCQGEFSGNICEPNSIPCPTGLQGDTYGTVCNYSPPQCSTGFSVFKISLGSYYCQPTNPPPLSDPNFFSIGKKVGAFTIAAINQYNVTGYYNNPYPIERPGLGAFTIMHVGDTLNLTCDGSAPLVITAIIFPDSITVSTGKSSGGATSGCPICLSADTQIDTPAGKINVKDIHDGTIVWSVDSNRNKIPSKIIKINKLFVGDTHKVIDLKLADGRELFVSPNHPTYDGRMISDLKVGEKYDGTIVESMELVQYQYQFTYDILPDGESGDYIADGILVGSTLK